jgi:hypothetical protein
MTVLELLEDASELLLGSDATLDATAYNKGLRILNSLINEWSTRRYGIYTVTREALPLVAGTGVYSMGPSGDFDTPRPIRVMDWFVRDSDGNDYTNTEIVDRGWSNGRGVKGTEAIPYELYYEPSYPLGSLSLYPVPDKAYTLHLDSQKALSQYTALTNVLNLPPEYETALKFNLAIDWANALSVEPSQVVVSRAGQTLSQLKVLHSAPVPKVSSAPFDNRKNVLPNIYGDGR